MPTLTRPETKPVQSYWCPGCGRLSTDENLSEIDPVCPTCGTDEPLFVFERTWPLLSSDEAKRLDELNV